MYTEILQLVVVLMLTIPMVMLLVECLAASFLASARENAATRADRPRVTVIVPAHNESAVIRETLSSIQSQLDESDRLCVVADNCADDTAEVAEACGAYVLTRHDTSKRAKGYALGFGLAQLDADLGEVVIMIDADCQLGPGSIDSLARTAIDHQRPVQAVYRMHRSSDSKPWSAVSQFAVLVKNLVRPLGLHRLGHSCLLTGSAMAFPAGLARRTRWASDHIVEDMQVSYELLLDGQGPRFCPEASVTAVLPSRSDVALAQRTRWEHGHLQVLFTQLPKLLWGAVRNRRLDLFVAAADLSIPPLSLLVQVWLLAMVGSMVTASLGWTSWLAAAILLANGSMLLAAIGVAWWRFGRGEISAAQLAYAPAYALGKAPLYLRALFHRQTSWNRTVREAS